MKKSKPKTTMPHTRSGRRHFTTSLIVLAGALTVVALTIVLTIRYLRHAQLPLETYRSPELGFSLQIPAGWQASEATEYQQVAFSPAKDGAQELGPTPQPGIAVSRNQPTDTASAATADKYFTQLQDTLKLKLSLAPQDSTQKRFLEHYRSFGQERATIGKHPALIVRVAVDNLSHQTGTNGQGIIAYVYVSAQRQYVLALTAPDSAETFVAQQQRILSTFRTLE